MKKRLPPCFCLSTLPRSSVAQYYTPPGLHYAKEKATPCGVAFMYMTRRSVHQFLHAVTKAFRTLGSNA